jgi:glycosyltransferase involved in cell wall biosynthesis
LKHPNLLRLREVTKILLIAHYFPPVGGAGVQRTVKFIKYLPLHGFFPIVLTGTGKNGSRWTPEDSSLSVDVPPSTPIYRTTISETAGLKKREVAKRRIQELIECGSRIIREHRPALIFVTMSPFDDAVAAAELSRRHCLPWVADLRDPWALDEFQVFRTRWHRIRECRIMAKRLASAAAIIMNTREALQQFRRAFPRLAPKALLSITNGFDGEDFAQAPKLMFPGKFNLVHSGYFHADFGLRQANRSFEYRLLGRTRPGVRLLPRSHFYLVRAVKQWVDSSPEVGENLAVVCLGSASTVDQGIVDDAGCTRFFTFAGYTAHTECLQYLLGADLLFLPMHAMPASQRATIVPGKTYEYLGSGRPILAAVPPGDARDFVAASGTGQTCDPEDVDAMVRLLRAEYARWKDKQAVPVRNRAYLRQFERSQLTAELAGEFKRVLSSSRSGS